MSIADKITRLQNAKTAIATAITNKGGTVTSGDGFEDFANDIGTISTDFIYECNLYQPNGLRYATFPNIKKVVCKFTQFQVTDSSWGLFFSCTFASSGCEVVLDLSQSTATCTSLRRLLNGSRNITTLTLVGVDTSTVTNWISFVGSCAELQTINGELDFSGATASGVDTWVLACQGLQNITIKPNTVSFSGIYRIYYGDYLTNESLISIANGMNESVTGQTITISTIAKNKLSTIMGDVTQPTGESYHIFTANESGTTTLQTFITETKGWSIA